MADDYLADIPEYPRYQITRAGLVTHRLTGRPLLWTCSMGQYPRCSLYVGPVGARRKSELVHRLVATVFVVNGDPSRMTQVDHKDGNVHNYHADNLEWVSPSENASRRSARRATARTPKRGRAVNQVNPTTGITVARHASMQAAAKSVGLAGASSLRWAVDKTGATAGGFWWTSAADPAETDEEWKPLSTLNGVWCAHVGYYVSSAGRIRRRDGYMMNPCIDANGYLKVMLSSGYKKTHNLRVHRLVAELFIPKPEEAPGNLEVDHIDGNRANNRADNLQWLTAAMHATKTHGCPVLKIAPDGTTEQFATLAAAAMATGTQTHDIWMALRRPTRTCAGCKWAYVERQNPRDTVTVPVVSCSAAELSAYIDELLANS